MLESFRYLFRKIVISTLVVLIGVLVLGPSNAYAGTLPSEASVYQKLMSYKNTYPEGTYWGDNTQGANNGKYNPISYATMYGCAAFAAELQDAAFGTNFVYEHYDYSFDNLRVGDILRINNDNHSLIVIEKKSNSVVVAEGNYGSRVHWGREFSKDDINSVLDYVWSRWPEGALVSGNFYYMDNGNGTVTVTGIVDIPTREFLVIPSSINGKPVTKIGSGAFSYQSGTAKVFIPDSVTELGPRAFFENIRRTGIVFGKGLTTIGEYALADDTFSRMPVPERDGYVCSGWYDDYGNQIVITDFLDAAWGDISGKQNHKLTARFTPGQAPTYSYTYLINYEGVNYPTNLSGTMTAGKKVSQKLNMKSGFTGWEIIDGMGYSQFIEATSSKIEFVMPSSNVIILAHYGDGNYYIKSASDNNSNTNNNTNNNSNNSNNGKTGLAQASDGNWYLYKNGYVDSSYTGLYNDSVCGWWLVRNGKVDFDYNDLYEDANCGWWKVSGGAVDFGYTDLYNSPTCGWWKINGGRVEFEYSDLYNSPSCGWWKVNGGAVDFGYTDLYNSPSCGWWKVNGGCVDFGYTDLYNSPSCGWWKVDGGCVDFGYTDLYNSPSCGWWKVNGGSVDFGYTDLYNSPSCGWWKVNGGSVDFGYTDLYNSPSCGWWKVNGGSVDFGYTGWYNSPSCGDWYIDGGAVRF